MHLSRISRSIQDLSNTDFRLNSITVVKVPNEAVLRIVLEMPNLHPTSMLLNLSLELESALLACQLSVHHMCPNR